MKSKRKKTSAPPAEEAAGIRRTYFECRFGQLHVTTAFPVGGGFDDHATLLCLHRSPLSSRMFRPFMEEIGRDRSVYAPDLPGCGESDPPPAKPAIADYAAAIADFLDHLRLPQVDVLGHQTGSLIAAELALLRPAVVRRLVLVGLPILNAAESADWARSVAPLANDNDESPAALDWMPNAALSYAAAERLPLVMQPALLIRAQDPLWEASLRAKPWMRQLKALDLPGQGNGVFRSAPREVAAAVRSFLDR